MVIWAWLEAMASKLALQFLWGLAGKVISFFMNLWARYRRQSEIKKQSEESVQPLKDATTAEEIDHASDDALSGF